MLASAGVQPSTGDLQEVRQRVLGALGKKTKRRSYLGWAAVAAALAVTALLLPYKQPAPVEPTRIAAARPPAPPAHGAEISVVRHERHPRGAGLRSVALIARAGEAPSIKIVTADPSIVILLPPEPQGNERTESNDE